MSTRKKRKLRKVQYELVSLVELLLAEAYWSHDEKHYRFKIPYGASDENEKVSPEALMVVDISVYFDGEVKDEREDRETKLFKITGPDKDRH